MSECWRQGKGLARWVSPDRNGEADGEVRDKVRKDLRWDDSKLQRSRCALFLPSKPKSHPLLKPFLLCNHSCAEEITCLSERGLFFPSGWQVLLHSSSVFRVLRQIFFFLPLKGAKPSQQHSLTWWHHRTSFRGWRLLKTDRKCNVNVALFCRCTVGHECEWGESHESCHTDDVGHLCSALKRIQQTAAELMSDQSRITKTLPCTSMWKNRRIGSVEREALWKVGLWGAP